MVARDSPVGECLVLFHTNVDVLARLHSAREALET